MDFMVVLHSTRKSCMLRTVVSYCTLNLLQSRVVYQSDQHQQVSICCLCGRLQGGRRYVLMRTKADKGGGGVNFCYIFADVLYG